MRDRNGNEVKLTEARWTPFKKEIAAVRGLARAAPCGLRRPAAELMIAAPAGRARDRGRRRDREGDRGDRGDGYELAVLDQRWDDFHVQLVETETTAATEVSVPPELFASPMYARLRKAYAQARRDGRAATVHGQGRQGAETRRTFEQFRASARPAKDGHDDVSLQGPRRDEPRAAWETTMDPAPAARARRRRGRHRRRPDVLGADG